MTGIDRRRFLALAGGAFAAPAGFTAPRDAGPLPWNDVMVINALGALGDMNTPDAADWSAWTPGSRVMQEAIASGMTAVNITLGFVSGPADPFESSIRDVASADAAIRGNPVELLKVYMASDILRAKAERKIGLIYGFQNSAMVGQDPSRVDVFADLGVRVMQLTYNPANQLGDGSMAPANHGLTPLGREVIARLNTRHVMVDLSHSGERTCLEAARASKQPISINHTGCRALSDLPRNKTDEELRLVASKGGFVGIYFMPFLNKTGHATASDVVRHIEHAVDVCGEDVVGIGTDGTVTSVDDLEAYKAVLAKEHEERSKAGISATGEGPDTLPFVLDLRGVEQFHSLAALLQKRGHSSGRIEKILGRNFLRFARDVWGG